MSDQPRNEEEIRQRVREAMRRAQQQQKKPQPKEEPHPDGPLLPILRSASSSPELELYPHVPVIPGVLFATFARVSVTPQGTIGMMHVLQAQLGGRSVDELMAGATKNIMADVKATVRGSDETPDQLVSVEREGYLAASAIVSPEFPKWISGLLGEDRLVIALPCPDQIYVTGADSYWADHLAQMVLDSDYEPNPLRPTLLLWEGNELELIVEQPARTET